MTKIVHMIFLLMIFILISCDSGSSVADSGNGDGSNNNGEEIIVDLPYDVGETLMSEHLDLSLDICYGLDQDSLKLRDLSGKVILLNLSASW